MAATEARLRQLLAGGQLELPLPAQGDSVRRLLQLHDLCAGESVSVGRLLEAHCDAAATLAEAGRALPPNVLAGVWASRHSGGAVRATPLGRRWRVSGSLRFCSGASIIDVALVDDPSSTLDLALTDGVICDNKGSATFTIAAATGAFAGLVVLPGAVRVTLIPGVPGDTAQYRATIATS